MVIATQTSKQAIWLDEAGNSIPFKSIKPHEKINEQITYKVATSALKVHSALVALKLTISDSVNKAIDAFHKQYAGKRTEFKGNYTIFNFGQTTKVEVSVSNPIKFDDLTIQKAKDKLDQFLGNGLKADSEALKQMVLDAFATSRGKLDVKKIMGLQRYADRINAPLYTQAMQLINQAIRRPATATYYRVAVKQPNGEWEYIKLNLADI